MLKTVLALTLAAAAAPALAGEVRTATPFEAKTIATPSVQMVAYFAPVDADGYEVTATWLGAGDETPARLVLRLDDGDAVRFTLPGHADTDFTFARRVDAVTITTTPAADALRGAGI